MTVLTARDCGHDHLTVAEVAAELHCSEPTKGGHFAAWEQPQLFSEEVRAGFRSLR
jgi:pimeloyl-ACP methyl ester carboxylesterase